MTRTERPIRRDYRQHLEVETPEHVVIDYEIAGLGSRALAALVDTAILVGLAVALTFVASRASDAVGVWLFPIVTMGYFALLWGYFALFEGLREGQTPGKRRVGIRVIRDTGHPIGMREASLRNLLRIADFLPPPYLLGAILVGIHPRGKRLGDLVAGTVVVRDRPVVAARTSSSAGTVPERPGAAVVALGAPLLTDAEFRVVREFADRAPSLPPAVRDRLATQLTARLAVRFPVREQDPVAFLATLLLDEGERRRGRFATRGRRALGSTTSGAVAERLAARKGGRWDEFDAMAARASRGGLRALSASELPDFAARYREIAADLARARTYGADPIVRARLERLVAAGHNLLYRDERQSWRTIARFFAVECPAAVVQGRTVVFAAFLAFAVPALGGYAALRERPELAEQALPQVMLERAEAGRDAQRAGVGYAQAEARVRGMVSSSIITNNLGVAFACFAGGVFLGVGSLVSLAFNGLLIGAVSGHFHNVGLLAYLWTFVAGHGVLELFAIWCAGGAGLLLGLAIARPGDRSRRESLVLAARLGVRLIGASLVLLLVAGAIEGFVSTSEAGATLKVGVSAASAILLAAWLANGARSERRRPHSVGVGIARDGASSVTRPSLADS